MKTAIITGASSGIGAALARELARRGWSVALLARRRDLLEEVARTIPTRSFVAACDVIDAAAVRDAVERAQAELGPCDLAVANAGVSIPGHATKFNLNDATLTMNINVVGMLNLFAAVVPSMVERHSGRFVGIASVAGLRGLPTGAVYSASKAAMQAFLEASRIELAPYDVGVTIVNPGFIATPLTEKNRFKMPFLMQVDPAARIIADGIEHGKRVVEFPRRMSLLMRTMRHMPDPLYDVLTKPYAKRRVDPAKVKR